MKKLLLLGFLSMFGASQANASFITNINGADMAGIEITGTFNGGTTQTFTWAAINSDTGGVSGSDWSLSLSGETFGEYDDINGVVIGAWVLSLGSSSTLESLFIDLGANFVFDTAFGDASANGSGPGVDFDTSSTTMTHSFGGLVQDELYSTLLVENFEIGTTTFLTDTDAVSVSAPETVSIFMLSLLGLVMNSRRKQA
jgi:hypothetical protein